LIKEHGCADRELIQLVQQRNLIEPIELRTLLINSTRPNGLKNGPDTSSTTSPGRVGRPASVGNENDDVIENDQEFLDEQDEQGELNEMEFGNFNGEDEAGENDFDSNEQEEDEISDAYDMIDGEQNEFEPENGEVIPGNHRPEMDEELEQELAQEMSELVNENMSKNSNLGFNVYTNSNQNGDENYFANENEHEDDNLNHLEHPNLVGLNVVNGEEEEDY
jgi:hypothetical protein